ncbi:hypothetical protein GTP23_17120 [Pseudoduganella sp. FT93W]|uniref:SLATT domain-containing protein n=1 Tax=Duganella fentianensis TaxID=2692177 RepID=A0A845I5A9_9BURK|nr:mobilome CxxCx(11)CxxC protein [Duganella fentianensis]MYN46766.1 hypothetical protein [Duganella fentianensis]
MTPDEFKKACDDHLFWCYGTSAIFQRREQKLKKRREWITYLGIIGPLVIGSVVGAFGKDWKVGGIEVLPILVLVASLVGIAQIVLSCWALVARWDEAYASAQDSVRANTTLYNRFKSVRDFTTSNYQDALKEPREENARQEVLDRAQSITPAEERYAYNASMKYLGLPCRTCQIVPTGKSSKCTSCGNW